MPDPKPLLLALVRLFIFTAAPAHDRHAIGDLKKHPDKKIAKKQNADCEKNTSDPGVLLSQPYEQLKIPRPPLFHGCDDPLFSQKILEARSGFEPLYTDLQSAG